MRKYFRVLNLETLEKKFFIAALWDAPHLPKNKNQDLLKELIAILKKYTLHTSRDRSPSNHLSQCMSFLWILYQNHETEMEEALEPGTPYDVFQDLVNQMLKEKPELNWGILLSKNQFKTSFKNLRYNKLKHKSFDDIQKSFFSDLFQDLCDPEAEILSNHIKRMVNLLKTFETKKRTPIIRKVKPQTRAQICLKNFMILLETHEDGMHHALKTRAPICHMENIIPHKDWLSLWADNNASNCFDALMSKHIRRSNKPALMQKFSDTLGICISQKDKIKSLEKLINLLIAYGNKAQKKKSNAPFAEDEE